MVRKEVDSRIHTLLKNTVHTNHRSFFVLIGDQGKDQIVNLHWMLTQTRPHKSRPSVLWCYKKELGFTSHQKKRQNKLKRDLKRGHREVNQEDPFEMFVTVTDIRYTYYRDTHKILGNTFGMLVLQDFEALTPNLLARTVETVEGGGMVVLLLKTMKSLRQLYTMTMDVHARYRAGNQGDVVARFNERFILSLVDNPSCLVVDDELNVLPVSLGKSVKPLAAVKSADDQGLRHLQKDLQSTQPLGHLVDRCRTLDQAQAIMQLIDCVAEKSLRQTVSLTAGRGRGKSAALGLALAGAVAYGYSNIFVTSPSPENLKTVFEFVFKGFDALGFEEHTDYDIIKSNKPEFQDSIVRVNVFKEHRQTIQYIQPQDSFALGQAELLIIDEAAAIPLPLVKKLLGPYLVLMASTINGYEGTGRSLSLKLIKQLREGNSKSGRSLKEIALDEPIRYSPGDPTELWLNRLLCLDASLSSQQPLLGGFPHPDQCELYWVNRDALLSYHPVSEAFLQRLVGLLVASHYKNSPNDLQLMSDAPGHQVFVLLPPNTGANRLPDPLCVIQVSIEGAIAQQSVKMALGRGERHEGDLIPWLVSQQYQDSDFASLSGARIVRIATHPDCSSLGYGSRALSQLKMFYGGQLGGPLVESNNLQETGLSAISEDSDQIKVRDAHVLPPLLVRAQDKPVCPLHWLGVSYGLTQQLHKFWKRAGYTPVYVRQTANDLTGEFTCVMLDQLQSSQVSQQWLQDLSGDFKHRFGTLLSFGFRQFPIVLAISIMDSSSNSNSSTTGGEEGGAYTRDDLARDFSPYDLRRLQAYANHLVDYHVIVDMLPTIATHHFSGKFSQQVSLSSVQSCVLLALGLQRKTVDDVEQELNLPARQVLALLTKVMRKFSQFFRQLETNSLVSEMAMSMDMDIEVPEEEEQPQQHAMAASDMLDDAQRELIQAIDMSQYAIDRKQNFDDAQQQIKKSLGKSDASTVVSVKSSKKPSSSAKKDDVIQDILKKSQDSKKKRKVSKKAK